jgi:hypothetical protein
MPKPKTAAGYDRAQVERVRATCLYVATKLGDLLDELMVVGGLVPTLLIDQGGPEGERHVGTLDLDIGMTLAILDGRRYEDLTARLRAAGFSPDENEKGSGPRDVPLTEEHCAYRAFANFSVIRSLSPIAAYLSWSLFPSANSGGSAQTPCS